VPKILTIAARIPIMAITIIKSISVKPPMLSKFNAEKDKKGFTLIEL
jgi:hypothetical protein